MPSIEFYLEPSDGTLLLEWLSAQHDIRFVGSSGIAVPELCDPPADLVEGRYILFHSSYESLPVRLPQSPQELGVTAELYGLMNMSAPQAFSRLEESHPAIFSLSVSYKSGEGRPQRIGLSSMGWIGRRFEPEGLVVEPEAEAWWRVFRKWVTGTGKPVSRTGALDDVVRDVPAWAFPSAFESLRAGAPRAANVGE